MAVSLCVIAYILLASRWFCLNWKNTVSWLETDESVCHLRNNKFFLSYLILQNIAVSAVTPFIALFNVHAISAFWCKKEKNKVSTNV